MTGNEALNIIGNFISNSYEENGGDEEELDKLHDALYVLEGYVKCMETAIKEIEMESEEMNLVNDIASKIIGDNNKKKNNEIISAVRSGMKMAIVILKKYKKLHKID